MHIVLAHGGWLCPEEIRLIVLGLLSAGSLTATIFQLRTWWANFRKRCTGQCHVHCKQEKSDEP